MFDWLNEFNATVSTTANTVGQSYSQWRELIGKPVSPVNPVPATPKPVSANTEALTVGQGRPTFGLSRSDWNMIGLGVAALLAYKLLK